VPVRYGSIGGNRSRRLLIAPQSKAPAPDSLVVQTRQMVPTLHSSSPPRKRGSRVASDDVPPVQARACPRRKQGGRFWMPAPGARPGTGCAGMTGGAWHGKVLSGPVRLGLIGRIVGAAKCRGGGVCLGGHSGLRVGLGGGLGLAMAAGRGGAGRPQTSGVAGCPPHPPSRIRGRAPPPDRVRGRLSPP
jgi:hypothetical protein